MAHFGGMNNMREIGASTSGSDVLFGGELNRSIPPLMHMADGTASSSHYSTNALVTPHQIQAMHSSQGSGSSAALEERLNDSERLTLKGDKEAIYS